MLLATEPSFQPFLGDLYKRQGLMQPRMTLNLLYTEERSLYFNFSVLGSLCKSS